MSDQNTSLPVRTESNGDVAVKLVDGTVASQALAIDSSGRIVVKLQDGGGTAITSQVNGAQRALDVGINVAGVQIDPRSIRAITASDIITAAQGAPGTTANSWPVKVTDGTNVISLTASGEVKVTVTQPLPTGTNTIGSVKLTDGTTTVGVLATGEAKVSVTQPLPTGTNSIGAVTQGGNWSARLQDGSGTAITSSAAGATRPLDVALRDSSGTVYSASNPMPVSFSEDLVGTEINSYNTASAVAAAATSTQTYTVTALKTLQMTQVIASASGKLKIEVQQETGVATGVYNTKYVQFNSTSNPNIVINFGSPLQTAAGVRVQIIRSNLDKTAQDVYSTICGQEV